LRSALFTGPWTAARLATVAAGRPLLDRVDRADDAPGPAAAVPDWLRSTVWIVGVLALMLTLVVGYLIVVACLLRVRR